MDYPTSTDETLVEAVKKNDDNAFQELMRRYMAQILRFSQQYMKTVELAEDVVQDTFFKAWRHIKRFTSGRAFKPWIFTIARNTALDHIKKRRASSFSELDDAENDLSFADTLQDEEPLATELFEQAELATELTAAMEVLHPDHRAVLTMHYREELTFDEIALVIGKPMNTVKSWHRRAVIRLREAMAHRKP